MAFMQEASQFNPWIEAAAAHSLPRRRQTLADRRRIGIGGRKRPPARWRISCVASYCPGREEAKGVIKIAERQLQRIYR
jgi:hypothetical protein